MLTATASGNNIILKISNASNYQLERKVNTGSWEAWDGTSWGGVPVALNVENFTDYDLSDGVYQYRYITSETVYSNCVVIGDGAYGWTFGNYVVPDGEFGEILTPDDMRLTMLFGTATLASNGQEWTDEQSRYMVESATYQLEKALNIDIFPREYYSDDDVNESIEESKFVIKEFAYPNRRKSRYNIRSRHRPVREVTRLDFYSPTDNKILDLLPWLRPDRRNGKFRIYPRQGKLQSFTANSYPWVKILDLYDYDDAFHIDYKTGYKTAELIPEDLREIIAKITALKMLNVIGDGLLAGFSSSSLSLDGLSESFSSTQSATSATYGARIKQYADDVEKYIAENRNKYGNFRIGAI
jgi:hypothetical protein